MAIPGPHYVNLECSVLSFFGMQPRTSLLACWNLATLIYTGFVLDFQSLDHDNGRRADIP